MIKWIAYDSTSREIESHVNHLITDGTNVWVANHAKYLKYPGYGWHKINMPLPHKVTHWAKINLPKDGDPDAQ